MENTREKKVEIIFANHPKQDVIYMTSKDIAYFNEEDAKAAAALAGNKQVEKFERKSVPADEELEKQKAAQDAEYQKQLDIENEHTEQLNEKLAENKSAEPLQTEIKGGEAEASPAATNTEGEQLERGAASEAGDTANESAPDSEVKTDEVVKETEQKPVNQEFAGEPEPKKAPVKKSNTKTKK